MINKVIQQAYIKKKVFKRLSEKSHDRKFQFSDRLREPVIFKPTKKIPDTKLNFDVDGIRISNNPVKGFSISPDEFKTLEVTSNTIVLFERGQIYNFGEKDFANASIVVKGYGAGVDAIIRGSSDISTLSWTDEGGGIWSTPMAEEPNWIWIDGECAKWAESSRITIASRPSTTQITVNAGALSGFSNTVGMYLVAKDKRFRLSKRVKITNLTSNTLTVDGEIDTSSNIDFALYGKFELLSVNNEWAWEAGELRVKAAASPSTIDIRVSSYDYCFKDSGNTEFDALEFKEYYQFGITSENGVSNIHDCYFHDIRDTGVLIKYAVTGCHVNSNTFERIGNCAIYSRPCSTSTYNNNSIDGAGMQENYGWQTWESGPLSTSINVTQSVGIGIAYQLDLDDDTIDGTSCEFNGNTIINTAFNAISVHVGTDNFILRNTVSNFMNRFADGGGIYTFHYRDYNVPQENTEIANNIIYDGKDPFNGNVTAGIYCDNRTLSAYVHDNTVYDIVGYGLLLNGDTKTHIVTRNKFINCSIAQVFINNYAAPSEIYSPIDGITFNDNILYCGNSTQRCMSITSDTGAGYNPYSNSGAADDNYYINPYTTAIVDSHKGTGRTLAELQSDFSQDAASVYRSYHSGLITNETASAINGSITDISLGLSSILSQSVGLSTNADIQFERTDPFTIAFKFRRNGNPSTTEIIFSNLGSTNRGIQISIGTSGQVTLELRNTVTTNRYQCISSTGWCDGEWHTIMTFKKATFTDTEIHIDGTDVTTSEVNNLTATIVNTDAFIIGNRESASAYLTAEIDKLAIWNSDQEANEAAILASDDYTELATPPLHYWEFTAGSNDSERLLDTGSSSNKLNGTGSNMLSASPVDVDLTEITSYTIPAHSGLIYLIN